MDIHLRPASYRELFERGVKALERLGDLAERGVDALECICTSLQHIDKSASTIAQELNPNPGPAVKIELEIT